MPSTGQMTKFVYDNQNVVRDIHQDGSTVDYLNELGVDEKLRQTSAAGTFYFTADHLGSTTALTDTQGYVVERMTYDSFGNAPASPRTRYTFTGRERDEFTGLYYYRARWYDSQVGRFISEDPIGFAGGDVNLYGYVGNNPLNFKDPYGHEAATATLVGGAAASAGIGAGAAVGAAAVGYGALLYGAWHLGEWLAEQPWNPLTHPQIPPAADCPTRPMPRSTPTAIPAPPLLPPNTEECRKQYYACRWWVTIMHTDEGTKVVLRKACLDAYADCLDGNIPIWPHDGGTSIH